jgi:kynurenine/2-aminoadipate aminotransferase
MISLGGGMPDPSTFPFKSMTVELTSGDTLKINQEDTAVALQYSATAGIPSLVDFLEKLQIREHRPSSSAKDFQICVTNGSQEAICKAFEMLISPQDTVLVESPTYSGTLAILKPMNCRLMGVETDQFGILPDSLASILDGWDGSHSKPKIIYTVPTACNPTGATTSLQRKQLIYQICHLHNLLILEDDPYYYLQFSADSRVPSYFSLDKDGRVLRFDSFSKVLSSGMRLGFVTGPAPLIDRIVLHSQVTS